MLQLQLGTGRLPNRVQELGVREINLAGFPEIKQMDNDRDSQGGKSEEELRIKKCHFSVAAFLQMYRLTITIAQFTPDRSCIRGFFINRIMLCSLVDKS
jgi:hypothetical protein